MRSAVLNVCLLAILTIGAHVCSAASGPAPAPASPKIAVIANRPSSSTFWEFVFAGVRSAAKSAGADVQTLSASNAEEQSALLQKLASEVSGIAISVIDPKATASALDAAAGKTKLITVDSDAPDSKRSNFIGIDNYEAGRKAGELLRTTLPNGGKVAILSDSSGLNLAQRIQGTTDGLLGRTSDKSRTDASAGKTITENGITLLPVVDSKGDANTIPANVKKTIADNPDLAGVAITSDSDIFINSLADNGKLGKLQAVAFDEQPTILAALSMGLINGTVVQGAYDYGVKAVTALKDLIDGKQVSPDSVKVDAKVVKPADATAYVSTLESQIGKSLGVADAKKALEAKVAGTVASGANVAGVVSAIAFTLAMILMM